jgi:hypothetical protein
MEKSGERGSMLKFFSPKYLAKNIWRVKAKSRNFSPKIGPNRQKQ